jgi:FAD synthase
MVVGDSFRAGRPPLQVGPSEIGELIRKYTSSAYLRVLPPVVVDDEVVSSSAIRRCLLTGDLGKASRLLGRAYSLDLRNASSEVLSESSQKRLFDVRTLGLLLPKAGEYVVEATAEGRTFRTKAFVSENHLALELPVRIPPDGITFLGA